MRARDFQKPVIDMLEQGCRELARALEDKPSLIESFEAWNETQSLLAKITGDAPRIGQKYSVLNLVIVLPGKMLLQQGSSRPIKLIGIKDRGSHLQYEFDAGDRIVLFPEDRRTGDRLSKTFFYSNPLDLKKIQTFISLNLDGWDVRDRLVENFADGRVNAWIGQS